VDVASFGETALLAARRPPAGRCQPWSLGPVTIANGGSECAHLASLPGGTLGVRGPLAAAPYRPFDTASPAAALSDQVHAASGHLDTGYACRTAFDDTFLITAPPAGLVAVGGYRFAMQDLQLLVREIDERGVLAALPHALTTHRLAGDAADPAAMREALRQLGVNPLLTTAFRDRAA
jgi:hypothetical protein